MADATQFNTAVPTIRIKHDGFPDGAVINAAEFDKDVHEPFDAADAAVDDDTVVEKKSRGKKSKSAK